MENCLETLKEPVASTSVFPYQGDREKAITWHFPDSLGTEGQEKKTLTPLPSPPGVQKSSSDSVLMFAVTFNISTEAGDYHIAC